MQAKLQRWGNSLAIRIPKVVAQTVNLTESMPIKMTVIDGRIIIEPQSAPYCLDEMLKQVTNSNIHQEVDFGPAQGKEIW